MALATNQVEYVNPQQLFQQEEPYLRDIYSRMTDDQKIQRLETLKDLSLRLEEMAQRLA